MELLRVHTNCIKVQFGGTSKMPSDKEIFSFFRKRSWSPDTLTAMFRVPREHSVYVKFQTEDNMKSALLSCPPMDSFEYDNGVKVPVTFATATGDFRYVRVFGLPVEIEDQHLRGVLAKYGKVHRTTRERYGPETGFPILNGIRGVHNEVEKPIPEQLYVKHFQVRAVYEGMPVKYYVCESTSHVKADCPKRAKNTVHQEKSDSGSATYAQTLANVNYSSPPASSGEERQGQPDSPALGKQKAPIPFVSSKEPGQNVAAFGEMAFGVSGSIDPPPPSRRDDEDEEVDLEEPEWFTAKKRNRDEIKKAENGSDSSEPDDSKVRLLDKQVVKTRARAKIQEQKKSK